MKKLKLIVLLFFTLWLTGCSVYSLIPPGPANLGELVVDNPANWSQRDKGVVTSWTRDGELLNLIEVDKVKPGKHILNIPLNKDNKAFTYNSEMGLDETTELYLDAIAAQGIHNINLDDRSKTSVDGHNANKISFHYDTDNNLRYKVIALLIKKDEFLHRLVCKAPAEHYFPTYQPQFEHIINSARFSR